MRFASLYVSLDIVKALIRFSFQGCFLVAGPVSNVIILDVFLYFYYCNSESSSIYALLHNFAALCRILIIQQLGMIQVCLCFLQLNLYCLFCDLMSLHG